MSSHIVQTCIACTFKSQICFRTVLGACTETKFKNTILVSFMNDIPTFIFLLYLKKRFYLPREERKLVQKQRRCFLDTVSCQASEQNSLRNLIFTKNCISLFYKSCYHHISNKDCKCLTSDTPVPQNIWKSPFQAKWMMKYTTDISNIGKHKQIFMNS